MEAANERQKQVLVDKVVARFGEDLRGRRFALWGLAFKPNTDDMREAPSRVIVAELLRRGAHGRGLRPGGDGRGAARARRACRGSSFVDQPTRGAARVPTRWSIVTEWKEFRSPDFDGIKAR